MAHLDAPLDGSSERPNSQNSKHSRASSDLSLLRGFTSPPGTDPHRFGSSRAPRLEFSSPLSGPLFSLDSTDEDPTQTVSNMLRSPGGVRLDRGSPSDAEESNGESDGESVRHSEDIPILQRGEEALFERSSKTQGISFGELVDRLLSPRLTRADNNFAEIFLCLYRKCAAPSELFKAVLARLDRLKDDRSTHYLTKTAHQLRIIEVVAKWVSSYPGDFARPKTRQMLEELVVTLSAEPIFNAAAMQMKRQLETSVVEDDDTSWENSDKSEDGSETDTFTKEGGLTSSMGNLQVEGGRNIQQQEQRRPSASSEASHHERQPVYFQFHTYDDYEREAATMVPTSTLPLTKFRYHIFMQMADDDIADELTRLDWVMFSSIRIRDMVRHVSLPASQRDRCKSLKKVSRMIEHFNHIARWVANMILMRDKAKHRALMLEKFMNISLKLRQLNNYNGLAAVLAGITSTAVHRLAQTRHLVPQEVQKRFARLVLLMGTQKSHFAYRLAWENSPLPRIPFIPLHRRDLVSAEEGSKTFIGQHNNRINWKKFEVLGEVLLPIMRSQGTAYPNLHKHQEARQMILDCVLCADEDVSYH